MADPTIALGIKPPNLDIATPLKAAADINLMRAQEKNVISETATRDFNRQAEDVSRSAKALLMYPEGSEERRRAGQAAVGELHKKGYMNNLQYYGALNHEFDDATLNRVIAQNVPVATHAEITGEASRAQAAGRAAGEAPYRTEAVSPETSIVRPSQLPGAPPGGPTQIGGFRGPSYAQPGAPAVPPSGAPGATPAAPGAQPTTGPSPQTTPAPQAPPLSPAIKGNAIFNEVPRLGTSAAPSAVPGTAYRGKTPTEIKMENDAADVYNKEIREPGMSAQQQRAGLGTLRSTLNNGWNTSRAAPVLENISAWMYAAGLKPTEIQRITGINPTSAEIANKESIQDSMKFVRNTIGARESLMAINAVRSAFPNTMNTKEANLALIDSMDQTAKWTSDRANYAAQFLRKNSDVPKNEALDEFNRWWDGEHPLESYVSKAVPWQVPIHNGHMVRDELKRGVTYEMPDHSQMMWTGNDFRPVRGAPLK